MSGAPSAQAAFAATLVDEWVRAGIRHAVIAPGSRSTPLTLALAADGRLRLHVVLDERSAGFVALGLGLGTGWPAVVVTTSGTASVELHPAVVEAHHAGVALIAVTADRPPELQGVGAPQTVHQAGLFGSAVRWAAEPGVADMDDRGLLAVPRRPGPSGRRRRESVGPGRSISTWRSASRSSVGRRPCRPVGPAAVRGMASTAPAPPSAGARWSIGWREAARA